MRKSKTDKLGEAFGGKWKYNGFGRWDCDDGIRYVFRCCSLDDSQPAREWIRPVQYWLYGAGDPQRVDEVMK